MHDHEAGSAAARQGPFPQEIPLFPLSGVLLLPCGLLPLNIFEPRYLAMVDDAMAGSKLIGMIQPREPDGPLYDVGCAGRITSYEETGDNRYLITLTGASRFRLDEELPLKPGGYRAAKIDWAPYAEDRDTNAPCRAALDRDALYTLLKKYFDGEGMSCNWDAVREASDSKLLTCLSMVCPFTPHEKQALLEAPDSKQRADLFMTMLDLAVRTQALSAGEGQSRN